jgi:hypothetical protein
MILELKVINQTTDNLRSYCINVFVRHCALILLLVIAGLQICFAQLQLFPLESSPNRHSNSANNGRKKAEKLTLPFWDDFSDPDGVIPDTLLWADGYRVRVNNGIGINQPTTNVATFDGLDSLGLAYDPKQVLVTGFNDNLTSQKIDLSQLTEAERGTVYLSFFFQWKGNGEEPDAADYLQLQFLERDSTWKEILQIHPNHFKSTVFYDTIVHISDTVFFHDSFQFRFRNFGRQSGPYDTWNVDYVYLNKDRTATDLAFPDRAIASSVSPLFGTYRSLPYRHYKFHKTIDSARFDIQNLSDSTVAVNYTVTGTFKNYIDSDSLLVYSKILLDSVPIGRNENNEPSAKMDPFERVRVHYDRGLPEVNDPDQFHPDADSVDIELKFSVLKDIAGRYQINDTITSAFQLRNYYAYDDGTAEYSAGLIQSGNVLAYKFDMLLSDSVKADTLNGFDFYFPPYGITSNQTVTFIVYHDDNGKPGEVWQSYPPRAIQQKGINKFQHMIFNPALLINEEKFYIGWRQPVEGKALVGLDVDNNTGDRIFYNLNGDAWIQNDVVEGSLMIRPTFGKGTLEDEFNVGVEEKPVFAVYPNPSTGSFYIQGNYDALKIYSITGTEVPFEVEASENLSRIQLNKTSGLLLLRITRGKVTQTHKILISR